MASYVVHTGRSWKGTIGRTEIAVTFDRRFARRRVRAVASSKLSKSGDGRALAKAPFPPAGTVLYAGVGKPTVRGRTLTFVRTNWRPKESDDLRLWFGFGHPVK